MSVPKPFILCLSFSVLLLSLGLWALRAPSAYAIASLHPWTQPQFPTMILTKTVGTDPTACATTSEIRVVPGTPVYECLTLTNTSSVSLTVHTLRDTRLGNAAFVLPLAVGQTEVMTQLQGVLGQFVFTPTAALVSTATLSATGADVTISATASVRVTMIGTQGPDIALAHTLNTAQESCGTTDLLDVVPEMVVYSCFTAVNTSSKPITLTVLSLPTHYYYDPALPPPADLLIVPPFIVPLAAGESAGLGSFPFTATVSTNTTGTVLYHTEAGTSIAVTATARVNVIDRQFVQTYYLPLIYALPMQPAPVFSARMDITVSKSKLHIGETFVKGR